jgi:hypothetical protein
MARPLVSVFGSSRTPPGDPEWLAGERCGELLARAGFAVATGGYGGTMEAVSAGAARGGAPVVGITAPSVFPDRPGANRFVAEERAAATLVMRIGDLIESSAAVIALPGSLGTLTELVMAWNLAYVAPFNGTPVRPVVAVGPAWAELIPAVAARIAADPSLVTCVATVEEAVAAVVAGMPGEGG